MRSLKHKRKSEQLGLGLIEVLVAMIVVAVGLLGLGALHLQATRASGNSAYYSQAVWVVNDIVSRLQRVRPTEKDNNTVDKYKEMIKTLNDANTTVFGNNMRCNEPLDCSDASTSCTTIKQRVEWALFDAGCPSQSRSAGTALDLSKSIKKPIDWFNEPSVELVCVEKSGSFYSSIVNAPPGTSVPSQAPDCTVNLSWSTRSDIPETPTADGRSSYSLQFELGRGVKGK